MKRPLYPSCRGFTLLEVMIAVAILAGALLALVSSQSTAVLMTADTEKILTATMLACEKMAEVQIRVEREGFTETDIEEEGDFSDFGTEDATGTDLQLEVSEKYQEYRWAWTLRKIDISLAGDINGLADQMSSSGYWGDQQSTESSTSSLSDEPKSSRDITDLGISPDALMEQLGNYIREIRVVVWWGENEDGEDSIELVTHVINPTGEITSASDESGTENQ